VSREKRVYLRLLPRHRAPRRHFPSRKRRAPARSLTAHRFRPSHPRTHEPNQRTSASARSDRPRVPPPPVFSTRPIAFGKSEKVARFP
jgi:hypothetical protein